MTTLTDLDALVARLNDAAYRFGDSYPVDAARQREAAAALVQLRERIAALEAERADLIKINNKWAGEWDAMREERDALLAKIAALDM